MNPGTDPTTATREAPLDENEAAGLRSLLTELGEEAAPMRFRVAPNPCVGAAVLSAGRVIGRAVHREWGGPHAEVGAFAEAAKSDVPREEWDTLVVTLEPCSTHAKTPPCVEAILAHGIRRVVVGELDPDPRHRGAGLAMLHEAGVDVVHLPGVVPLREVAPHFLRWVRPDRIRRARPWAIAKWAQTRSGHLTPPASVGEGRWITSEPSLRRVQVLRAHVDAIVTGVGTVRADDPRLTVRPPGVVKRPPLRIVLDTELRMEATARMLGTADAETGEHGGPVHIFCRPGADGARHRALADAGATIHAVRPGEDGRPLLREVLSWLHEEGARRILVEAGPRLLEAFLRAEFIDQLAVYTGDVNGGRGPTLAEFLAPERLEGVCREEVGSDSLLEAFVRT
ncbi:MAG TPA: bifunctional diaminohydroxyphosphoribosylaminopyrimidine deaminase/5-amino-6-(5-phosphoribosylamino)uracil reductase RibD [Planctomycetes bacterium]|nr:bifunctional diaminohydroxyphosphoribosylaminopyrimidine deaminase/5-amino-6-(5-phosphoribosylamino)uracil reductase RibD [Planctomycetota bacterium]